MFRYDGSEKGDGGKGGKNVCTDVGLKLRVWNLSQDEREVFRVVVIVRCWTRVKIDGPMNKDEIR